LDVLGRLLNDSSRVKNGGYLELWKKWLDQGYDPSEPSDPPSRLEPLTDTSSALGALAEELWMRTSATGSLASMWNPTKQNRPDPRME
jgi:hypothetical protein